jgi:hypothetical protein
MAKAIEVKLVHCRDADGEHRRRKRQYAHSWHYPSPVVCLAQAYLQLPPTHSNGVLAHEVGHLLAGPDGDEAAADRAVLQRLGVHVRYRTTRHGRRLQWISGKDALKLMRAIRLV